MGFIGKLLAFAQVTRNDATVSDATIDPGGGANVTGEHFTDPGDDSQPLPEDYVAGMNVRRSGGSVAVGYIDPASDQKAGPGEKRIYARDDSGASVVEVFLKNDGTAVLSNALGSLTLLANGTFNINGVTIDANGSVVIPTGESISSPSMVVDGKELKDHTHGGVTTGGSNTGPNN